jgi:hypothetical protein
MAQINCVECRNNVSGMAPSCPKCGVPIATMQESMAAGTLINTFQATSKKFKILAFISGGLIIFSLAWMMKILMDPFNTEINPIPLLLFFIGFIWFIVKNRVRI